MYSIDVGIFFLIYCPFVRARGILLLTRPIDVTNECAFSTHLRYDLSFGNGLSDTITVVLRTIEDVDYECQIDIATDAINKMIVVIKFPTSIDYNCQYNPHAFNVYKRDAIYPICSKEHLYFQDTTSKYWLLYTQGRFRFKFRSNSSVNSDIDAFMYMVTATTARKRDPGGRCDVINETDCFAAKTEEHYCMTSGVVCDGIQNCGISDWYDERKSECEVPVQRLGYAAIFALMALLACATIASIHILRSCLTRSTSFFIYDSNEANKLRIDAVLKPWRDHQSFEPYENLTRKSSLIPVYSSSDDDSEEEEVKLLSDLVTSSSTLKDKKNELLKMAKMPTDKIKSVSERIHNRIRSIADNILRIEEEPAPPASSEDQQ